MKKIILLLVCLLSILETFADAAKCAAKTNAGTQCSRNAKAEDTKCFQHSDKALRCGAKTKAGNPCKVTVNESGAKCHNHREEKTTK